MKSNHDEIRAGANEDLRLRVSVATLVRLLFEHPGDGEIMLALERKATMLGNGNDNVHVRAQPFGGGVRILNSMGLQKIVGEIQFDSERSRQEGDFRILIPSFQWELVKQYCLRHLINPDDPELETLPHRELVEEFEETLHVDLRPDQYVFQPAGFVIENNPVQTNNIYARGKPTVRLYRIFEVRIVDAALCEMVLATSQQYSDQDLGMLAQKNFQNGGRGHANSILTLPLSLVTEAYLGLAPDMRYRKTVVENHPLDESVLAVLNEIAVPQYQRI
jgi:hypothetical protein